MEMSFDKDESSKAIDFHGSLEEFHLPDIIQFLSGAGKTGVLRLVSGREEGSIYLEGGRIKHALFDYLASQEAVYELLRLTEGNFDFEPGVDCDTSSITSNNTNLLIEAARRKDEWQVISERIQNINWVPQFVPPDSADTGKQVTLNTSEWIILSKIDGERSIKEIAKACKLSVFQTSRFLFSLVENNLIRLSQPSPSTEDEVGFPD
jgi:hypothetical protein